MVGILLLSHGTLCEGALDGLNVIMGSFEKIAAIPLTTADNTAEYRERVARRIDELDDGDGVLVMVDIMGGTPFNTSARLYREKRIRVICGLNLPMLISAVDVREACDLPALANACLKGGIEGIRDLESLINA